VCILVLRRPGCSLCRDNAKKLYALKDDFEAASTTLVCVVHEGIKPEIEAFRNEFWPGPLYLDEDKALYRAIGEGKVRKGSILSMLNPFGQVWKNARKVSSDVKGNLTGDGFTLGGLIVARKGDGRVQYAFQETTFGDAAPAREVLAAAKAI